MARVSPSRHDLVAVTMLSAVLKNLSKGHWWQGCTGMFLRAELNICSENSFPSTKAWVQLLVPGTLPVGITVSLTWPCHLEAWSHLGPPRRSQPKWSLLFPNLFSCPYGTHSSEGKDNRGKRTSNRTRTWNLCSNVEYQPRKPRRPVEISLYVQ